jgi:hypothetical protein
MRLATRRAVLSSIALASLAAAPARAADDASALVARVLAAYGGRAALEKAHAVMQEGTVTSVMHEGTGRVVRLLQRPGSLRIEIAYPGGEPEVRVVHAGYGDRNGVEVTGTPAHAAMVLQAARLSLPLLLTQKGLHVEDGGTVARGGVRLRVLHVALGAGLDLAVEVDPATSRIVRTAGGLPGPGGQRLEFATEYSAFQKFSGVLFATHEESWARGQHTGATQLTRVEVLARAPDGAFDEPL